MSCACDRFSVLIGARGFCLAVQPLRKSGDEVRWISFSLKASGWPPGGGQRAELESQRKLSAPESEGKGGQAGERGREEGALCLCERERFAQGRREGCSGRRFQIAEEELAQEEQAP